VKGVVPNTIAAIMVDRSLEMIIGVMGILKAGGAYLPIDPDYPKEHSDFMLKDSATKILLTDDLIMKATHLTQPTLPAQPTQPHHLAYVIYTSGSTGKPKGVMVEHSPVVNVLYALQQEYPFEKADTYLLKTSYVFDVSVTELFGWYMGGGKIVILEKGGEKDPGTILDSIERNCVSHINFVPAMFRAFLEVINPGNIDRLSVLQY
ncbi:MAG: amino acid adenylation domain-containing protein, partial [bacterium]|nr:amino acid adenylation domain-containing protein [bacterium]